MRVSIYTRLGCIPCKHAKIWLHENNIKFNEVVLKIGSPSLREFSLLGGKKVPFIVVETKDEQVKFTGLSNKTKNFILVATEND